MLDITYREALHRHGEKALYKNFIEMAEWKELEVGTKEFWDNISGGKLAAFESSSDIYVGIVHEYDLDVYNNIVWIYFIPDPTHSPLPESQEHLPVCFGLRDKIMMEVM
jgi:hypothetical protein